MITNFRNSIYQFNKTTTTCIPQYEYCLPTTQYVNNMAINYDGSDDLILVPLPYDYEYGDIVIDPLITLWIAGYNATPLLYPEFAKCFFYSESATIWYNNDLLNGIDLREIWDEIGLTTPTDGLCYKYVVIETDYITWNVQGYSQCLTMNTSNLCDIVYLTYSNNSDSLGLPKISNTLWNYSAQFVGKLWKPQLKSTGRTYTKSNGELIVVNSRSDEIWQLDINMMNYEDIRNLTLALKSDKVIIYNLTGAQFGLPSSSENTQFYLEEDITIPYSNKCFASARISAKLRLKSPVGFINYNC